MCTNTTSPNVIQEDVGVAPFVCSRTCCVTTHSKATVSATRGASIFRLGAAVRPASANSSTSGATPAELAFIARASGRVARFHTNVPVDATLRAESL